MVLSVKFNGYELSDYLDVLSNFDRGIGATKNVETKKFGENSGKRFISTTNDEKVISMPFVIRYDLIEKRRILAGILNVKEPKKLVFGDEPNKFYYAVPTGTIDLEENNFMAKGTITWLIPDGLTHSTELESAAAKVNQNGILSVDIDYKGTEETPLTINIHNNSETGYLSAIGMHGRKHIYYTIRLC